MHFTLYTMHYTSQYSLNVNAVSLALELLSWLTESVGLRTDMQVRAIALYYQWAVRCW
jgi:hypothetical protein